MIVFVLLLLLGNQTIQVEAQPTEAAESEVVVPLLQLQNCTGLNLFNECGEYHALLYCAGTFEQGNEFAFRRPLLICCCRHCNHIRVPPRQLNL